MPAPSPITVFGVKYPSVAAAASVFGHSKNTFYRHITAYHEEPEAFLACPNAIVRLYFVGPDNRGYYHVPSLMGLFTARQIVEIYRPDLLAAYDADNPTGTYKPYC